ncbi:MAG TPA: HAMP domain-containing sensor histidine kinase [Phototrophicaceae bacterium]|nr:HAMP domain-containing sensor histidine kinase [Phototrophicaceae bacterium]
MLHGLRARLFISYLFLLAITLTVIGGALVFILNTRAAPPDPTYEQLATLAVNINLRQVLDNAGFNRPFPTQSNLDSLTTALTKISSDRGVRILLVNIDDDSVLYDSAGVFSQNDTLKDQTENYVIPPTITRNLLVSISAVRGSFTDPKSNSAWLFVGIESLRQRQNTYALLFADPQPTETLQDALTEFGTQLFPLLVQAAVVGLVIAILLAILITRSIARPLQTVAKAASEVANGRNNQSIPISGPEEVQAVAKAFNSMSEKVRAEQRSQQDFLANVSHDLKTPLTSIQGYSQAIIDGIGSPTQAATIIHQESERLNRMVLELTDLARLQAGRLSMKTSPVDIGLLTNAVAQRLSIVAREKGIELEVNAPSMPEIAGDGDRLVQVVDNLISNAVKYTPTGGKVTVTTQVRRNGVELTVEDTGQGIPASELPRIFERFYQVDKARGPQRGTGLGLAIVQEIVQAHGGTISVASPGENRGSTFTVWLPSPTLSTIVRRR